MFELQTLTAQAEYNNKKALMEIEVALLTMKDDVYTKEIRKYRNLLVGFTYKLSLPPMEKQLLQQIPAMVH